MHYQWQFQPYQRCFKQALQTRHGLWTLREGILLRLVDEAQNVGWGEIAPIPWFGSETLEQALAFCHQLPAALSDDLILSIPDALPCCQFAFESAWEWIRGQTISQIELWRPRDAENQAAFAAEIPTFQPQSSDIAAQNSKILSQHPTLGLHSTPHPRSAERCLAERSCRSLLPTPYALFHSALLPAGKAALHSWKPLWEQGFRTFKWKIGVHAIATELELLHKLTQALPSTAKLRLDANAGLSIDDAILWLQACDAIDTLNRSAMLEYIEQPLAVSQFHAMQTLSGCYRTPIALDESVATLQQLQTCYKDGWRGIFVVKPAIVGSPARLRQFCEEHPIDAVFSSAFETAIGRQAGLRLAAALGNPDRAMGYGTRHWFDEAESNDFEPQADR